MFSKMKGYKAAFRKGGGFFRARDRYPLKGLDPLLRGDDSEFMRRGVFLFLWPNKTRHALPKQCHPREGGDPGLIVNKAPHAFESDTSLIGVQGAAPLPAGGILFPSPPSR